MKPNLSSVIKRIIAIIAVALFTFSAYAQNDVTKFLGIPVDGKKEDVIEQLKSKGFEYIKDRDSECLSGRFNGRDVLIFIKTDNGKVWRIAVCDLNNESETDIRIHFNNLLRQFGNNGKYLPYISNTEIPETENISYEINVNNKRYEASFFQILEGEEWNAFITDVVESFKKEYPNEELQSSSGDTSASLMSYLYTASLAKFGHREVWISIADRYGTYNMMIFYDNKLNMPNGEDL